MKLLLPVAGLSSRFPGVRPKYLLTFPDGKLMLEKSIEHIDFNLFSEVIIGPHIDHLEKYIQIDQLSEIVSNSVGNSKIPVRVVPVKHSTSQADTCLQLLEIQDGDFSFAIKDCDNTFIFPPCEGNAIAYVDLNDRDLLSVSSPSSKSYIEIDSLGSVKSIIEKRVISSTFACGYYQFISSQMFINTANRLIREFSTDGHENAEVYVSHCIFSMITSGETFTALPSSSYYDFGDLQSFNDYNKSALSIFCDFDGVIVKNSSKFDQPPWQFMPIEKNIQALVKRLSQHPASKLVITTSRPSILKKAIHAFLDDHGLACAEIICDLPHSQRLLINDYANSNPFPSCSSVSIKRDADILSEYLN